MPDKRAAAPPRPALPDDEEPHLPRAVRRDIERILGPGDRARDVALALSVGSDALDLGRVDVALQALGWAKHLAPRVAAVREAYGVARYLDEDFSGALTELQAYRRMTGRTDQNHVIADCLRGLDRDVDRVGELAEELLADTSAPAERRAEAAVVWAAALADDGQRSSARALLRRHLGRDAGTDEARAESHELRVLVLAARLAEQDGDLDEARAHRRQVVRIAPDLQEEAVPGPDPGSAADAVGSDEVPGEADD